MKKREGTSSAPDKVADAQRGRYSPEAEEKRATYENIATSLLILIEADMNHVPGALDIDLRGQDVDDNPHLLMNAISEHIFYAYRDIDWFSPEGMRLYVEMRLLADQQHLDLNGRAEDEAHAAPNQREAVRANG
jgi:hypothetical protein